MLEQRCFKTAWFAKAARKAGISDKQLVRAIKEAQLGQVDDLGGGVFKKRLNKNEHRGIILAKGKKHWFYVFLFAKKDRANIDADELAAFRKLAKSYEGVTIPALQNLMEAGDLVEIDDDTEA